MASEAGPTATEAPPALSSTSTLPPTTPATFAPVTDLTRQKSLKRARETTPTSQESLGSGGDISPSKIARLVGFARQSHPSSTGDASEGEGNGRPDEEEQQHLARLENGENQSSAHRALDDLMSGVETDGNRAQDGPSDAGRSDIEAAAAAAARALSSVNMPSSHVDADGLPAVSPQSGASAANLEDGDGQEHGHGHGHGHGHVVDSPAAMDVESRNDEHTYGQQPEAQMEDKGGASLSYPGAMPASGPPQRVLSMPIASPQTPTLDLAPRSPSSNKKHKCPYCETEFTRHHNLKSHLLTHSQEKPFVCQSCQMRFRRLHDLKRHSKLHTGEKPHVCPSCDRKFARGDALARHSKGAGGCAGRRQTMGTFGLREAYDPSNAGAADASALSGDLYETGGPADMTEEERRRLSMPSIKTQHVAAPAGAESYGGGHANTYPPAGQRPGVTGGLYPPPTMDRGPASSNTSPTSMPNTHTPQTSISSLPLSAGGSSMYSHSGMTESPKPLSPAGVQANAAGGQPRPANEQHQQPVGSGLSLPSHSNSAAAQHSPPGGRAHAAGGATTQGGESNTPGGRDPTLWAYFQSLEETVKRLVDQVEAEARSKAQLLEKLSAHDHHIAALTAEIASLRQQLAGPQEEGSPAGSAVAQQ